MKTRLLFLFIFYIPFSYAQEIQTKFISKTPLHADTFIGVDKLDHIYYVKNNVLFKKRTLDTINYSNITLGKITSVNIQNPFKIVIFYKDFNSIILLDNNLNELTNRIDLTKETLFNNIELVSNSSENDLWLYSNDTKLYLYDYKNHFVKFDTQPMNFYQTAFHPKSINSTYKNVWLAATHGVIQFNEYGNFIHFKSIKNTSHIFPSKIRFFYLKDNSLFLLAEEKSVPVHLDYQKTIKDMHITNSFIYIFDGVNIYKFKIL